MKKKRQIRRRETTLKTPAVIKEIIAYFKSQANTAYQLSRYRKKHLSTAAVHGWVKRGRIPPDWAPVIEALTDGQIPRQRINPKLFY